jgi:predicted MFS family arabinose efflux permease
MTLGTGAVNALEIVYAHTVLATDDRGYGLLLSAWGGGLLVGTLAIGWLGQRIEPGRLFVGAMALLGAMFACYAYAPNLRIALVIGVVGGLSNGVLMNLVQTLLQTLTPVDLLGRVGGFFTTVRDSTLFLSMLMAGALTDRVGVPSIFLVSGLILLAAAALPLVLTRKRTLRLNWLSMPPASG